MNLNEITIIVLTKNEEKNIEGLLNNVSELGCKILVIDSESTDKTREICKTKGIKVITKPFRDFASQRNLALTNVVTPWVFFLDADERVSQSLKEDLKKLTVKNNIVAVKFLRKTHAFGKNLNKTWRTKETRLIKVGKCYYDTNILVHEILRINDSGEITINKGKGYIIHYPYKNFSQYIDKSFLYIKLQAKEFSKTRNKITISRTIFEPLLVFIDRYIRKLWLVDGIAGLHASLSATVIRYLTLSLARSIQKRGEIYSKSQSSEA